MNNIKKPTHTYTNHYIYIKLRMFIFVFFSIIHNASTSMPLPYFYAPTGLIALRACIYILFIIYQIITNIPNNHKMNIIFLFTHTCFPSAMKKVYFY